jgi:TolB-like protein
MVQWGLAYLAGAWFLLQVMEVSSETWGISLGFQQGAFILLTFGFLLTLVLVWYHGEEGRQRVSGPELLIIAVLLVIAGGVLSLLRSPDGPIPSSAALFPLPDQDDRLTIAVLPFENFSPDPEDAYFADGMHEEILSKLSRISSLRVISRSSVMQFRESRPTVGEMAAQLGADFFLEGSARVVGRGVRITAQLINANLDDHVWTADYDQPLVLDSLIAVQSRIADSVATRLQATLTPDERARIESAPTDNLEAYELYLHGRFLWNQRTEPDLRRSLELFQQAIALDSLYALAYVGLADAYLIRYRHSFAEFDDAIPQAERALQRALSINPLLGEAHASLGSVQEFRWDIPGAIQSFHRSHELAPNHATAHQWYALLRAKRGAFEEALTHARFAAGLDPLSRMIDLSVGWILHMSRDHAAAASHLEGVTSRMPDFALAWLRLGEAYTALGRYEEALTAMGRGVELEPWPNFLLFLAWCHGMAGNEEEARAILEQVPFSDFPRRAQVHAVLGETQLALQWLEEGIGAHSPTLQYLGVDPVWDPIRSDPGFQEVLRRLGFIE